MKNAEKYYYSWVNHIYPKIRKSGYSLKLDHSFDQDQLDLLIDAFEIVPDIKYSVAVTVKNLVI